MQPFFIETIRIEDGSPQYLGYHQRRLEQTIRAHFPEVERMPHLYEYLPSELPSGRVKWRVVYSHEIDEVSAQPYETRPIESIKLINADAIEYPYKSLDRSAIDELYQKKESCSDVLIVRQGLLTDTSIANIALGDGHTWLTPQSPLLGGTTRARLLDEAHLKVAELTPNDLELYPFIAIFNALIPFGSLVLPTTCVKS